MRNLPITYNLVALTLFSLVVVLAGFSFVVYALLQDHRESHARGAVLMISMRVEELHQKDPAPTQAQIDENIRELVTASVINAGLDAQQRPIDSYGTPFRLRHTVDGALHRVTATSAGPDRHFDTPDDISRDATWETLSPANR